MAQRLGELLVQQRIVTPRQLDEALKAQMIYGGRLGTNLVELGHITLDDLAQALGAQRHMPVATTADFEAVIPQTLELISADTAAKFVAFPLFRDGPRRVRVAMLNPYSIEDIDQLGFITGMRVVPYIAPELQLYFHLERHYGITRDARYIRLGPDPTHRAAMAAAQIAQAAPAAQAQNSLFGSLNPGEFLSGDGDHDPFENPAPAHPAQAGTPMAPQQQPIPVAPARTVSVSMPAVQPPGPPQYPNAPVLQQLRGPQAPVAPQAQRAPPIVTQTRAPTTAPAAHQAAPRVAMQPSPPAAAPPNRRRMIEFDDSDSGQVELASPWEFATWQGADVGSASPVTDEMSDSLELAGNWEFVQWRPVEASTPVEPQDVNDFPPPTPATTAIDTAPQSAPPEPDAQPLAAVTAQAVPPSTGARTDASSVSEVAQTPHTAAPISDSPGGSTVTSPASPAEGSGPANEPALSDS